MATIEVPDNRLVVRPAEAAKMLGCSRLLVYRMVRDGKLHSVKDGNRRLIRVADIEKYLQSLEGPEAASA